MEERWRIPLVDVLGGVHDDGRLTACGAEPLVRGDTERLLVNVDHVGPRLLDEPSQCSAVEVDVPVHIAGTPHRELNDSKPLGRQTLLRPCVGPRAGHHQRDISACSYETALAGAVPRIPPTVVHA